MIVKLIAMWLSQKKRRFLKRKLSKEIPLLEKVKKPFWRRLYRRRPNYSDSNWAFLLAAGKCKNPLTREGKLFRRRFRVPYPIYEEIVRIVRERKCSMSSHWIDEKKLLSPPRQYLLTQKSHRSTCPILKYVTLRVSLALGALMAGLYHRTHWTFSFYNYSIYFFINRILDSEPPSK